MPLLMTISFDSRLWRKSMSLSLTFPKFVDEDSTLLRNFLSAIISSCPCSWEIFIDLRNFIVFGSENIDQRKTNSWEHYGSREKSMTWIEVGLNLNTYTTSRYFFLSDIHVIQVCVSLSYSAFILAFFTARKKNTSRCWFWPACVTNSTFVCGFQISSFDSNSFDVLHTMRSRNL